MSFKYICRVGILILSAFGGKDVYAFESNPLLQPYTGRSVKGVDTSTLTGKVMCGYQGWFNTPDDGAGLGWVHWGRGRGFEPGKCTIDLWPDTSEYDKDELYDTGFKYSDGSTAQVFSSHNKKTIKRHFEWMRDYGIDGAFVQRFANGLRNPAKQHHKDMVLSHCREGANLSGRAYAVMYDLSGVREGDHAIVINDWKRLRTKASITDDKAYLHHKGKPVVSVWGIGFSDGRKYTLEDCRKIIQFLKDDGCTVMLGVPTSWRKQENDAVNDAIYHDILKLADIISPWSVGRYGSPATAREHAKTYYPNDLNWCKENGLDYLPVVFPGFSWYNLRRGSTPFAQIPRLKGKFMWEQIRQVKRAGCDMVYVAMFDEVDEATAIFKCTNNPPTGNGGKFLTYEGLPSDFYLKLTGAAGKVMRGEVPATEELPVYLKKIVEQTK